jgi:isopenicillin N synthase-like dioxygenase
MWSCTCHWPPAVDLTEFLVTDDTNSTDLMLRETLSRYGWCIVTADLNKLAKDSPLQSIKPLDMKQQVQDLFGPGNVQTQSNGAIFRGRMQESGSAQPEPKQSWEVKRCSSQQKCIMHDWTRALHTVAVTVTRALELPPNLLLQEQDGECSDQCCNIDLLRVFYYDTVDQENESLGSSPHTDWGSWTVVWQDDVGGLQTYCHVHNAWVTVPAPPLEESKVYFVVHVGDVTSLAMGHAALRRNDNVAITMKESKVVWPSPKHRVVSPIGSSPRASLVYFAYPPPGISLKDMEKALYDYSRASTTPVSVPYDDYFVLQNQSTSADSSRSSKETYSIIRSRPLDTVFDEKWIQVQR